MHIFEKRDGFMCVYTENRAGMQYDARLGIYMYMYVAFTMLSQHELYILAWSAYSPDPAVSCRDQGDGHPVVWLTPQQSKMSDILQSPPALATSAPTLYGAPVIGEQSASI